jgi:hypothetical protein
MNVKTNKGRADMDKEQEKIEVVLKFIKQLSFGEVVVTVHDSEIVQVEKREKRRFAAQKRLLAQS